MIGGGGGGLPYSPQYKRCTCVQGPLWSIRSLMVVGPLNGEPRDALPVWPSIKHAPKEGKDEQGYSHDIQNVWEEEYCVAR